MPAAGATDPRRRRVRFVGALATAAVIAAVTVAVAASQRSDLPTRNTVAASPTLRGTATPLGSPTPNTSSTPSAIAPTDTVSPTNKDRSSTTPKVTQSIDPVTQKPLVSAPIGDPAVVAAGISASVGQMTAVSGEARAPGDIAGPAVRFELSIVNNSGETVNLAAAVVNLFYGSGKTPASSLPGPNVGALPDSLASGATARSHFVFSVPAAESQSLTVTLDYAVDAPLVAFVGPGPVA